MSRLNDTLETLYINAQFNKPGKDGNYDKSIMPRDLSNATQDIKALFLELVGEDEEYYGGTARANDLNDRRIHGRNRLRKDLRDKINQL